MSVRPLHPADEIREGKCSADQAESEVSIPRQPGIETLILSLVHPTTGTPRPDKWARVLREHSRVTGLCLEGASVEHHWSRSSQPRFLRTPQRFGSSSVVRALIGAWSLIAMVSNCLAARPNILLVTHPLLLPVAAVAKMLRRVDAVVFDAREAPTGLNYSDASRRLSQLYPWIVRATARSVDVTSVVAEHFIDAYQQMGLDQCLVVPNVPMATTAKASRAPLPRSPLRVALVGSLFVGRGAHELAEAVDLCRQSSVAVHCQIVGDGSDDYVAELQSIVDRSDTDRVEIVGPIDRVEVHGVYQAAHVIAVLNDPLAGANADAMPNKLYEALVAGRPVVCAGPTAASEFVARQGTGIVVGMRPDEIAAGLIRLATDEQLMDEVSERAIELAATGDFTWQSRSQHVVAAALRCCTLF